MENLRREEQMVSDEELLYERDVTVARGALNALDVDEAVTRAALPPLPPPPMRPRSDTPQPGPALWGSVQRQSSNPFRSGDVLAGRYLVERIAGRIGLGIIVHVRHVDLGQRLLLKCLSLEACRYPDAVARFLRGARAAMRLQSEHTVKTIDAGRLSSGMPYVVSEALSGCDLREVLRVRGALGVNEAVDCVLHAAEALAEAHAQGLVHRNINPATLFSTRRPDGSPLIKVLDFGVGEALRADPMRSSELGLDTTVFGSNPIVDALACSSPEQLRSSTELDERTDIWALGAVLHELLAGAAVYRSETVTGLLAMIAADPPMPITSVRSDVPAGLEAIILRCLAKVRDARFATVAELAVALKEFASPDTQPAVDRITRTLGRNARLSGMPSHSAALVHVGPAATPARASVAVAARASNYSLLWSTLLVAFGLVGGTIAGVLMATRTGMQTRAARVDSAAAAAPVEQRIQAAQPALSAQPSAPALAAQVARLKRPALRSARAAVPVTQHAPRLDPAAKIDSSSASESGAAPAASAVPRVAPTRSNDQTLPAKAPDDHGRAAVAGGSDLFDSMR